MRSWLALGLVVATGCSLGDTFVCQSDLQCGVDGRCQPDGFCSGPDDACESGQRYLAQSGGVAGQCVGGIPDGSTSAESSASTTADSDSMSTSSTSVDVTSTTAVDPTTVGTSTGAASDSSTGGPSVDPDLVAWYQMEQVSDAGTPDSTANGLDATCAVDTCPMSGEGVDGQGASFDGVDDALRVAHDPVLELTEEITVMAWGQLSADPSSLYVHYVAKPLGVGSGNSYELYYRAFDGSVPATMRLRIGPIGIAAEAEFAIDQWVHVAGTYDGQTCVLYIDGVPVVEDTVPGAITYDDQDLLIGADEDAGSPLNFFPGLIDDVRIYRRALSAEEIAAIAGK